jgi:hypothetical protein
LGACIDLHVVAFECGSHLREIESEAFAASSLQSIMIPAFARSLGPGCFALCRSLHSVMFEWASMLATIKEGAFSVCQSLTRLLIPASVTAIHHLAFERSGMCRMAIEEGSVSLRIQNDLLINFAARSLVCTIGSPESILIPSSVEELRPYCCASNERLRTVEFESDSNLRSIGRFAFADCESLESIWIPSSVGFLRGGCFDSCSSLRTVTFGRESGRCVIEREAFHNCRSLELVSVPASVEVIGRYRRARGSRL